MPFYNKKTKRQVTFKTARKNLANYYIIGNEVVIQTKRGKELRQKDKLNKITVNKIILKEVVEEKLIFINYEATMFMLVENDQGLKIAKYFIVTDTLKVINDNKVEHIKAVIENLREKFASYPYKPILKKLFINNIQIPRKEVNAVEMVMFSNGILNKLEYEEEIDEIIGGNLGGFEDYGDIMNSKYINYRILKISNETPTGQCVIDNLINMYNITESKIESLTNKKISDGFSFEDLKKVCDYLKINMYAVDQKYNIFKYNVPKPCKHLKPLMFIIKNDHMVLIDDISERKKLSTISNGTNIKSDIIKMRKNNKENKEKKDNKIVYIESNDITNKLFELIKNGEEKNIINMNIVNTSIKNNQCVSFKHNDTLYYANEDIEDCLIVKEKLGIENYINQSIHGMVNEYFKKKYPTPTSTFNETVKDVMFNKSSKRAKLINIKKPVNIDNVKAYDHKRFYRTSMYEKRFNWCIFDITNTIEKYDGELIDGLFSIETEDKTLLDGDGWYYRDILEKAKEENIKYKINYIIKPSTVLKPDYFQKFLDDIEEKLGKGTPLSKKAFNHWQGLLNKRDSLNQSCIYTTSLNDVAYYLNKYTDSFPTYLEDNKIWRVTFNYSNKYMEFNIPLYQQLLDFSHVLLYEMIKYIGGDVLRISTDCIIVENPERKGIDIYIEKPKEIPDFNKFKISEEYSKYPFYYEKPKTQIIKLNKNELPSLDQSFLLTGQAGTGKTFTICELIKKIGLSKCKVLGPTNKAVDVLREKIEDKSLVSTIHKFFGISINGTVDKVKNMNKYEYIIIDEISMVGRDIYKVLYAYKAQYPHLKFIFVGDKNQLPPVEEYGEVDYFDNGVITDFCKITYELVYNWRAETDPEFIKRLNDIDNIKVGDFGSLKEFRSLCYTNTTRININIKTMKKLRENYIKIGYMSVYKGLPVISKQGMKDIFKNEELEVVGYDNEKVLIVNSVNEKFYFGYEDFEKYFDCAYCLTVHKSQGSTYNFSYTVYEWGMMDNKMKYTALSRATCGKLINIL